MSSRRDDGAREEFPGGGSAPSTSGYEETGESAQWLTELLDSEAEHYEPDSRQIRTVLHERIDGVARGRRRGSLLRLRLAGVPAGIAVAAVCATVAVAVTATVAIRPHPQTTTSAGGGGLPVVGKSPSADVSPQVTASRTRNAVTGLTATASAASAGHSPSPSASANGAANVVTATSAVDPSSNASWSQENVNITLAEPVTSFQLSVKVSMSAGVSSTGEWTNYDITMFDVTVNSQPDGVTYKFQLKPGKSLPVGSAEFAVQFAHGAGHNPADDTYYLSAISDKTHGSASDTAQGAF